MSDIGEKIQKSEIYSMSQSRTTTTRVLLRTADNISGLNPIQDTLVLKSFPGVGVGVGDERNIHHGK